MLPKLENIKVSSPVGMEVTLIDSRPGHWGQIFGTVKEIAGQYGIKISNSNGITTFIGPKNRMQYLVEKLHFARVPYSVT